MIKSRMMWAEHVERMGDNRNEYIILVKKPEGKRLLGGRSSRWGDSIKMYLKAM
jgi:hypothetical protein